MPNTLVNAYSLRSDVVATVMADGAVLLDLRTKYFYSANPGAWAILQCFEAGADLTQLRQTCAAQGNGSFDEAGLQQFIDQLIAEDLVEVAAAPAWTGQWPTSSLPWTIPLLTKHKEPLQRVMMSAFDPSIPLAE